MEIKTYRIKASYKIQRRKFYVYKEIRDTSLENALERFFSEIGSRGIKRTAMTIEEIVEVKPEEIKSEKLKKIVLMDNPVLVVD